MGPADLSRATRSAGSRRAPVADLVGPEHWKSPAPVTRAASAQDFTRTLSTSSSLPAGPHRLASSASDAVVRSPSPTDTRQPSPGRSVSPFGKDSKDARFAGSAFFNSPTPVGLPSPIFDDAVSGRTRSLSSPTLLEQPRSEQPSDPFKSPPRKQQRKSRQIKSGRSLNLSSGVAPDVAPRSVNPSAGSQSSQLFELLAKATYAPSAIRSPFEPAVQLDQMSSSLKMLLGVRS